MELVIDAGNTYVKTAVFDGPNIIELNKTTDFTLSMARQLLEKHKLIHSAILSSVRKNTDELEVFLQQQTRFLRFDTRTPLPFKNQYASPETLGKDRIAATAGALELFPGKNVMVIDAGTCITYDMLTAAGEYLGGGISPGIRMRFDALHTFTGNLPLVKTTGEGRSELIGNTTEKSILSGVQNGVLQEVDGIIDQYKTQFPGLQIVVCGGDNKYFDKYLKNNIFAAPNLVLRGLAKILHFNEIA